MIWYQSTLDNMHAVLIGQQQAYGGVVGEGVMCDHYIYLVWPGVPSRACSACSATQSLSKLKVRGGAFFPWNSPRSPGREKCFSVGGGDPSGPNVPG